MSDKPQISTAKIQRYYRPLLIAFIVISCLIVGVIIYFSFSRTVILVTTKEEPINLSGTFVVSGKVKNETTPTDPPMINGAILQYTQKITKTITNLTSQSSTPAKAGGIIKVINNYNKNQPLVASTRFIADNGKLFRTTQRVDVPAGGSITVTVVADKAGTDYEIPASHFILPGLWPGLQDKIYGESSQPMTGGTTETKIATAEDIQTAKEVVRTELYDQGLNELNAQIKKTDADWVISVVKKEILTEDVSVEPNAAVNSFVVKSSMKLLGVSYDLVEAENTAITKASTQMSDDETFKRDISKPIIFTIERYDPATNSATIKAVISGWRTIKLTNAMFDRQNFINHDRQEINSYFSRFDEIQAVEVKFSPFWVVRAPALANHIEVRIK
jgi:hypothetical protein